MSMNISTEMLNIGAVPSTERVYRIPEGMCIHG